MSAIGLTLGFVLLYGLLVGDKIFYDQLVLAGVFGFI